MFWVLAYFARREYNWYSTISYGSLNHQTNVHLTGRLNTSEQVLLQPFRIELIVATKITLNAKFGTKICFRKNDPLLDLTPIASQKMPHFPKVSPPSAMRHHGWLSQKPEDDTPIENGVW